MIPVFSRLYPLLSPSNAETLAMLNDLVQHLGKPQTAALLSIRPGHISRIIRKAGISTTQTKAHVWLIWALVLRPGALKTGLQLLTFGRFTRNCGPQHAGGKPLRSMARRLEGRKLTGRYYARRTPGASKGGRGHKKSIPAAVTTDLQSPG